MLGTENKWSGRENKTGGRERERDRLDGRGGRPSEKMG